MIIKTVTINGRKYYQVVSYNRKISSSVVSTLKEAIDNLKYKVWIQ